MKKISNKFKKSESTLQNNHISDSIENQQTYIFKNNENVKHMAILNKPDEFRVPYKPGYAFNRFNYL